MCTCSILYILFDWSVSNCWPAGACYKLLLQMFLYVSGNKKWYPKCKIAHCGSRWGLALLIRMYTGLLWFPVLFPLKEQTRTGTITSATVIYLAWVALLLQANCWAQDLPQDNITFARYSHNFPGNLQMNSDRTSRSMWSKNINVSVSLQEILMAAFIHLLLQKTTPPMMDIWYIYTHNDISHS